MQKKLLWTFRSLASLILFNALGVPQAYSIHPEDVEAKALQARKHQLLEDIENNPLIKDPCTPEKHREMSRIIANAENLRSESGKARLQSVSYAVLCCATCHEKLPAPENDPRPAGLANLDLTHYITEAHLFAKLSHSYGWWPNQVRIDEWKLKYPTEACDDHAKRNVSDTAEHYAKWGKNVPCWDIKILCLPIERILLGDRIDATLNLKAKAQQAQATAVRNDTRTTATESKALAANAPALVPPPGPAGAAKAYGIEDDDTPVVTRRSLPAGRGGKNRRSMDEATRSPPALVPPACAAKAHESEDDDKSGVAVPFDFDENNF